MASEGPVSRWCVWSLDVWGNKEDGWEVNDRREVGHVTLPADPSDAEVLCELVQGHYLAAEAYAEANLEGCDGLWTVEDGATCEPILQLEREDEP